ncbi:hypothetical protein ACLOJK_024257 [Asimina triloba]
MTGGREALMGHIYERATQGGSCLVTTPARGRGRGVGPSPSSVPYGSSPHFSYRKRGGSYLKRAKMLEKQLTTFKDLDVIREGYDIPASILLSAPAPHETSRDHRPGHLCLNEYMLGAGVQIPFDFREAKALWAFNVSLARYAVFSTWEDVKAIDNPPDHVPGWESRFFLARLSSERDTWGIPEQWEEPLPNPIPRLYVKLSTS